MAFKLQQSATYVWPVKIVLPIDGGKRETHTFDATFRRLPQSRINEIIKQARLQERGRVEDDDQVLEDQGAAREIMTGWAGVQDDEGRTFRSLKAPWASCWNPNSCRPDRQSVVWQPG